MVDNSHLDNKYFIDNHIFNCPFCNRGNVSYSISSSYNFDWDDKKKCYVYFAECASCDKISMHLSFEKIELQYDYGSSKHIFYSGKAKNLDSKFFYSVPTSFFALDNRIPKIIRELYIEAEGCLKSNFLTGASVCVRKIIYELAVIEKAEGDNYGKRIKSLKDIRKDVESEHFDVLMTIQKLTSSKIHENSYDGWESSHLRMILSTLNEILNLMYVIPEIRKEKREAVLALNEKLNGNNAKNKQNSDSDEDKVA